MESIMKIDIFSVVVPVDDVIHAPDKPFCYDPTCECHEDDLLIYQVYLYVLDGLMTPDEATSFVKGYGI
jgi:hypothetical protein